jgi:hypothetical protein
MATRWLIRESPFRKSLPGNPRLTEGGARNWKPETLNFPVHAFYVFERAKEYGKYLMYMPRLSPASYAILPLLAKFIIFTIL